MKLGRGLLSDKQDRHTVGHPSTGGKVGQNSLPGTEVILQEAKNQGRAGHRLTDGEDDVQGTHAPALLYVRSAGNITQGCGREGRK